MSSSFLNDKDVTHNAVNPVSKIQPKTKSSIQPKFGPKIQPKLTSNDSTTTNDSSSKMPEEVQAKMENSFGEDFSDVSIHDNSSKAEDLGAKAFAQGKDVHFAPGEFQPNTKEGQELIGHELTHVVQQKEGQVTNGEPQGKDIVNQDPALEKEADDHGKLASEGKTVNVKGTTSGGQVQAKMPDEEFFMHQVLENETIWKIAEHYNVTIDSIKKLNNLAADASPAPGTLIKVPAPDEVKRNEDKQKLLNPPDPNAKPTKKPDPDKGKVDLGLKNQKNQIVKVSVKDFQEFLKLYDAYLAGQYSAPGATFSMSDAEKLKYLLGPLQNANPQLMQFKDKIEKLIETDVEKGKEALEAFWNKGWWSKLSLILSGLPVAAGVGAWVIHSVDLYMDGKATDNSPEKLTVENGLQLLENIKLKQKSKDLSGNITNKSVQVDAEEKINTNKNDISVSGEIKIDINRPLDDNNWNVLKENGYADKRIWYVPQLKQYMDTMTIRHQAKNKNSGLSSVSNIIDASNLTIAQSIISMDPAQGTEIYRVKDGKFYSIANIKTLYDTHVIDGKEVFAKKSDLKQLSSEPLISEAMYGKPVASTTFNQEAGIGLNNGNRNLDYFFKGGFKTSVFGGKISTTSFATNYDFRNDFNREKIPGPTGAQTEDWINRRIFQLQFSLNQDLNLSSGDLDQHIGLGASYTRKYTTTEIPGKEADRKIEERIALSPYWKVAYKDPANGKWTLQANPSFFWADGKFGTSLSPSLSYAQINQNSVLTIQLDTGMQKDANTNQEKFMLKGFNISYFVAF